MIELILYKSIDILPSHICDLINCILNLGSDKRTEGISIPLHKIGNQNTEALYL
jgi:hypothetical protein